MKPIDIVMFNMSGYAEWEHGVSNRNYHVLHELLNEQEVGTILAVDYPPLTMKRALRNYKENIMTSLREGKVVHRTLYDRLTKRSDSFYIYSNSEFVFRPDHFIQSVKKMIQKVGLKDYVVWSFFPPVMERAVSLGQKLTIFDAVDNWMLHPSYKKHAVRLKKDYDYIKKEVDVIFTVSEELQTLFDSQPNVYWVPNGVDLKHYQTERRIVNRDIADIPRPIVGYIGVIQERVDTDLIAFLAQKNPTKSFVLVGPVWHEEDKKKLADHKNIYLLGYKSYRDAPAYIQQFDVGLIPHRENKFITSTNPMKVYEYLACGKPVVATYDSGAAMFKDVIYLAADHEDFNRKLYLALEEDSDEERDLRLKAVEDYSWSNTVDQMRAIIKKKLAY